MKDAAEGKPGTRACANPRFSPDGTGIAFGAQRFVQKGEARCEGGLQDALDGVYLPPPH